MKHFVKTSIATAVVGAALIAAGSATAGIANTKHNLGTTNSTSSNNTAGTEEICIFCHTPHGGDIGAPVPLWNKSLTTGNFTTYDQLGTSTLDAAVGNVGSVSLACLTCHDGTQAIDNILNAPGSGGYDSTGGGTDGLLTADGWTWSSPDSSLNAEGQFINGVDPDVGGNNIFMIGTDLRNDHPVSMQYGGGGVSANTPTPANTTDTDFVVPLRIGTSNRWYVDNVVMSADPSSTLNAFDKWDFKLYTRDTSGLSPQQATGFSFSGVEEPFVECGSCHDPHMETTTFLRIDPSVNTAGNMSNSGSAVCLTCHTK
jgi:hypothetical protein